MKNKNNIKLTEDMLLKEEQDLRGQDYKEAVEWGETHQERILDHSSKRKSARHVCKGPSCVKAFQKS